MKRVSATLLLCSLFFVSCAGVPADKPMVTDVTVRLLTDKDLGAYAVWPENAFKEHETLIFKSKVKFYAFLVQGTVAPGDGISVHSCDLMENGIPLGGEVLYQEALLSYWKSFPADAKSDKELASIVVKYSPPAPTLPHRKGVVNCVVLLSVRKDAGTPDSWLVAIDAAGERREFSGAIEQTK